jgi:hypothetical protein
MRKMREVARKLWVAGLSILLLGSATALGLRWVGRLGAPQLALAPAELDFGRVAIGAAAESVLVATNAGARRLVVKPLAARGPFQAAAAPLALGPGESRALRVVFRPSERGPVGATLVLASDGHEFPVALRGTGYRPAEIRISPLSLSFGEVAVGGATRGVVTIHNAGDEALRLALHGARRFTPGTQSALVPPGEALALDVSFAPDRVGRLQETLWIESNDPARGSAYTCGVRGRRSRRAPRSRRASPRSASAPCRSATRARGGSRSRTAERIRSRSRA